MAVAMPGVAMEEETDNAVTKGVFAQLVGVCQAGAEDRPIWEYINAVRLEPSWSMLQPNSRDEWNQQALEESGQTILKNREKGVQVLPCLDYMQPWAARRRAWSCLLNWSAVGDNNMTGTATSYDIRWLPDVEIAVGGENQISDEPTPLAGGTTQSHSITGLPGETQIFSAIKVIDDSGNESDLSNSPSAATPGVALGQFTDLAANLSDATAFVGDNGNEGTAMSYDIRWNPPVWPSG